MTCGPANTTCSQFSGRSAANAALSELVSRGHVAGDQGQDAPQRAALFGAVPMLRPEDLLGQHCNSPAVTEWRLRRAAKQRSDQAADAQNVGDVDGRSRPVLYYILYYTSDICLVIALTLWCHSAEECNCTVTVQQNGITMWLQNNADIWSMLYVMICHEILLFFMFVCLHMEHFRPNNCRRILTFNTFPLVSWWSTLLKITIKPFYTKVMVIDNNLIDNFLLFSKHGHVTCQIEDIDE